MFEIEVKVYGQSDFVKLDTALRTKEKSVRFANILFNKPEFNEIQIIEYLTKRIIWNRSKLNNV